MYVYISLYIYIYIYIHTACHNRRRNPVSWNVLLWAAFNKHTPDCSYAVPSRHAWHRQWTHWKHSTDTIAEVRIALSYDDVVFLSRAKRAMQLQTLLRALCSLMVARGCATYSTLMCQFVECYRCLCYLCLYMLFFRHARNIPCWEHMSSRSSGDTYIYIYIYIYIIHRYACMIYIYIYIYI